MKMHEIAERAGYIHWLDKDSKNAQGWYKDMLSDKSFRGEEAQTLLEAQEEFERGLGEKSTSTDIQMWIGSQGYPLISDFLEETDRLGACKRINRIPKDLELGKTRVWLTHDEGIIGQGRIFGYFTVDTVEVIRYADEPLLKEYPEYVEFIDVNDAFREEPRGGDLRTDVEAIFLCGEFVALEVPLVYEGKRFRSYARLDRKSVDTMAEGLAPSEVQGRTINITKDDLPKKRSRWTPEEDAELRRIVGEASGVYQGMREFSRQTNRTMRSVEYRWLKIRDDEGGE